jgi:Family of unknown function (DUF5329)
MSCFDEFIGYKVTPWYALNFHHTITEPSETFPGADPSTAKELRKVSRYMLMCFLLLSSTGFAAGLDESERLKIEYLKSELRSSNCQYERNGTVYSVEEALKHINRKQDYFADDIDSALKFVELSATKSTMSGKSYYVICPGKEKVRSALWLQSKLTEYKPGS